MNNGKNTKDQLASEVSRLQEEVRVLKKEVDKNRDKLQQADYYRALFERSLNGNFVIDFDGNIIDANDIILEIMGYTLEESKKLHISSFLSPEQNEIVLKEIEQVIRTGKQGNLLVLQPQKKDGTTIWMEVNGFLLYSDGKPFAIQCISRDITEQKRTEEHMLRIKDSAIDSSVSGIIFINSEGYIDYCNKSFTNILEFENSTLISGESFCKLLNRKLNPPDVLEHIVGQEIWLGEGAVLKKNGSSAFLRISSRRIRNSSDELLCTMVSFNDISEQKRVEDALRKREEKYRSIVDNINELLYTVDETGTILFTNAPIEKFTGYDREYCIGRNFTEFIHNDDRAIFIDNMNDLLDTKDNKNLNNIDRDIQIRMITREDESIWINSQLRPFVDYQNTITGFTGIAYNITKRKAAEDALLESKEQYRMLADNVSDVIWTSDLDFRLTYVSPSIYYLRGYTPEEALQQTPDMVMTPESLELSWSTFMLEIEREKDRAHHDENRVVTIEADIFHKNGSIVPTEIRVSGLRDQNNKLTGLLGISRDITDRKLTEKKLLESETRYRELYRKSKQREHLYESLLNSTPDAVVIYNPQGRVIYINSAFTNIFGYDLDEIAGKSLEYVPEEEKERTEEMQTMVLDKQSITGLETRRLTRDGRIIDVMISSACYTDHEGEPAGYLVILRDITETRFIERQLRQSQRMEAIGTLAGGIAHDFNNLLQGIQGYTQLLLMKKEQGDKGYDELREIERAILRASSLTQQLLTFSRKLESNFQPVDINHEVLQVRRLLERTIPKMIAVELELSTRQLVIKADPAQIEQILMNLVLNARDSMPEGGRLIIETVKSVIDEEYCSLHVGAKPGHYVLLSITDTGHGMEKETVERIFEPFFTTKGIGKGSGLGLSIVYGIVKNHDGYINCYSEPALGTTFKIFFPIVEDVPVAENLRDVIKPDGGSETILLVDDEKAIRDVGERILTRFGYTVHTASDGVGALELYRSMPGAIDLVILDLIMPEMGGKRCMEEILALNPYALVIISSGYSESGTTEETLNAGARGFIRKPYELKKILKIVREVLDGT